MMAGAVLLIILGILVVGYVQVQRLRARVKALELAAPSLEERKVWEAAVRKALVE